VILGLLESIEAKVLVQRHLQLLNTQWGSWARQSRTPGNFDDALLPVRELNRTGRKNPALFMTEFPVLTGSTVCWKIVIFRGF
jgi:hypothetical protein